MQAGSAYNACMTKVQYTIRGVHPRLDKAIRERAARDGKSLNETLLNTLKSGLGLSETPTRYTDLNDLAGTWVRDPEFDKVIREMDRVDPELWK